MPSPQVAVTGLRHAGSPVGQPAKLSRNRQDAILLWALIHARTESKRARVSFPWFTYVEGLRDLRGALRLDDPLLDELIASGAHKGPWVSPADRDRASTATMDSIARKYGG